MSTCLVIGFMVDVLLLVALVAMSLEMNRGPTDDLHLIIGITACVLGLLFTSVLMLRHYCTERKRREQRTGSVKMKKTTTPGKIYNQRTSNSSSSRPEVWLYPCPTPFIPPKLEEEQDESGNAEPLSELSYIPETHYHEQEPGTEDTTGWTYTYE